jgi:hypothetical protein
VFDKRWWSWWKGLQPPSRQVAAVEGLLSGDHRLVEVEEDWDVLRKHGQNGFLTVLSTLTWWGGSINGKPVENFASWLAAVNEVHWVLLRLLELRYAVVILSLTDIWAYFTFKHFGTISKISREKQTLGSCRWIIIVGGWLCVGGLSFGHHVQCGLSFGHHVQFFLDSPLSCLASNLM